MLAVVLTTLVGATGLLLAPTPASAAETGTRTLSAEARLTGSGPVTAWLGGAAERTYILTVKNTGSATVTDPTLTLTVGKDSDPTNVLATPKIGTIAPGATLQYKLPVTLDAPAFGQYRVMATFSDLDAPLTVVTSTSSYPWILFLLGWLLLQPLLLGLYKRRPSFERGDDDPFAAIDEDGLAPPLPVAAVAYSFDDDPLLAPVPAGLPEYVPVADDPLLAPAPAVAPAYAPVPDVGALAPPVPVAAAAITFEDDPLFAPVPEDLAAYPPPVVTEPVVTEPVVTAPVVTAPVVTAPVVTAPVVTAPVVTAPVVTEPVVTTAVVPVAAATLLPAYRPVFGVTDLRAYLDPDTPAVPPVVEPRVVVGGMRQPPKRSTPNRSTPI